MSRQLYLFGSEDDPGAERLPPELRAQREQSRFKLEREKRFAKFKPKRFKPGATRNRETLRRILAGENDDT